MVRLQTRLVGPPPTILLEVTIRFDLCRDPAKFNGIKKLHIPSDLIWTPDILLYNNADGEPQISIVSDAIIYYNGLVVWKPPSIYKSFCNVRYYTK